MIRRRLILLSVVALFLSSLLMLGFVINRRGTGSARGSPAGAGAGPILTAGIGRAQLGAEPKASPAAALELVRWHGPVEQLFFHPLVLRPKRAFTNDTLGTGFQDYFVTAHEFRAILRQLWRNGWTLVDVHRAATGRVRVPAGRKPLVLFEDDVNYYSYFAGRGLASRLVLNSEGEVRAEFEDRSGRKHRTIDDFVPLVEAAVARHPEFSADGAKGVLAVTGYEGLFGEHHLGRRVARARVRALADRLRETGWALASHTFGHISLADASPETIVRDTTRWKHLTRDLIGPTDLLVYPFGSRPTEPGRELLADHGFDIQFDIDILARTSRDSGIVVMSRRHVDGVAFENPKRLAPFLDIRRVRDPARPQ